MIEKIDLIGQKSVRGYGRRINDIRTQGGGNGR